MIEYQVFLHIHRFFFRDNPPSERRCSDKFEALRFYNERKWSSLNQTLFHFHTEKPLLEGH